MTYVTTRRCGTHFCNFDTLAYNMEYFLCTVNGTNTRSRILPSLLTPGLTSGRQAVLSTPPGIVIGFGEYIYIFLEYSQFKLELLKNKIFKLTLTFYLKNNTRNL